jgi:hypothetical protein
MTLMKGKLPALLFGSMMVMVAAAACVENTPMNKAPMARIGSPVNGATIDTGVIITFDGSGSYDPEKKALTFAWNFGDNATGAGNKTTHSYALPGKYVVSLEVSDGKKKGNDRAELNIAQANRAPAARFSISNTTVSNEETVTFDASGTTDADNDSMAFSWSFGDGTVGQGKLVSHLYPAAGSYNVTLNVSDGKTGSSALQAMTVYQANRAPVPVLKAAPLLAFINSSVEFDASGSTDADNDSLTAAWDFGDGATGTGLKAAHSYSRMGNFTATGTVSDGKAARTATVMVTVLPKVKILLDWNRTDYGYMILPEVAVERANLSVSVASSAGGTDAAADITELAKDSYRATSAVLPSRGATLTVTARYWGLVMGARAMTIYENTPMPGHDCTAAMEGSFSIRTTSGSYEGWTNISGSGDITVRDMLAYYSLAITGGATDNTARLPDNSTIVSKGEILGGWSNQTFDAGAAANITMEISASGNRTFTNATGTEILKVRSSSFQKKEGRNDTELGETYNGTQYGIPVMHKLTTAGIEDHKNGAGRIFSCLKVIINDSADFYQPDPGNPPIHVLLYNETTAWIVRDEDRYTNTTIDLNFTARSFVVNDTTGIWTLIDEKAAQQWPDSNLDGRYNPDPKPLGSDEAFTFHGLVPRELFAGDRMTGTNEHGVTVVIEARDGGQRTVDGVTYAVILLKGTFSGAGGNASGSSETWIVSQGNLTGLTLESREQKHWAGEGAIEDDSTVFIAVRIEED